ncbi:MAG: prolipoprotein diacylglyceryl transferase [Oscillospiraceae bacterium]|nr:prolipoprotein diacylglyceryl transferase [Oscillospiraceae bacterium]
MNPDAVISFPLFGDGFVLDLPRYFTIFGFNIYYYGLFVVAGYTLAGIYILKRRKLFNLSQENIYDLIIIAILCGLVGARLYYMIFNFDKFFAPGQWGNIFRLREGGLAVYGGIIASGLGFWVYSRIKKKPLGSLLDAAGFGLFIGQAVGRWGNFINREAYGVETDLPWKMGLTDAGGTEYVHPTFLYESLWNVVGLLIMHIFSKKSKTKYPGQYFLFYVAWYGLGRFMIEGLRTDSLLIPGTDNRASQWLAAISFVVAIGILIFNFIRKRNYETVYGEDAEEIEDEEDAEELAELDGASESDVENESIDDDDCKSENEDDGESDEIDEPDSDKETKDNSEPDTDKETEEEENDDAKNEEENNG